MDSKESGIASTLRKLGNSVPRRSERVALWIVHTFRGPFVRLLPKILLLVGLLMQCVLLLCIGYMIDLSVSLMELWAELARKHLELTI